MYLKSASNSLDIKWRSWKCLHDTL